MRNGQENMGQIINGIDKRIYCLGGGNLPELSKNNFVPICLLCFEASHKKFEWTFFYNVSRMTDLLIFLEKKSYIKRGFYRNDTALYLFVASNWTNEVNPG